MHRVGFCFSPLMESCVQQLLSLWPWAIVDPGVRLALGESLPLRCWDIKAATRWAQKKQ